MKLLNYRTIRDYALTALVAIGVALLIRQNILESYRIPSMSMKPALLPGDIIFVAKWPYKLSSNTMPERGDIIVFSDPSQTDVAGTDYVRRVIALPGDRVSLKNGRLILNGTELFLKAISDRPHTSKTPNSPKSAGPTFSDSSDASDSINSCLFEKLPSGKKYEVCNYGPPIEDFGPETVPEQSVFVLGDLRAQQRQGPRKGWGVVPISNFKGKAWWIWLSIDPHRGFGTGTSNDWLPRFRYDRMFREIS